MFILKVVTQEGMENTNSMARKIKRQAGRHFAINAISTEIAIVITTMAIETTFGKLEPMSHAKLQSIELDSFNILLTSKHELVMSLSKSDELWVELV